MVARTAQHMPEAECRMADHSSSSPSLSSPPPPPPPPPLGDAAGNGPAYTCDQLVAAAAVVMVVTVTPLPYGLVVLLLGGVGSTHVSLAW